MKLRLLFSAIFFFVLVSTSFSQQSFKKEQLRYPRVRAAYAEKEVLLKEKLKDFGIAMGQFELFLRAFKEEKELEVWLKGKGHDSFSLFNTYDICASSGELGPKRQEGDLQVPEGFYHIDRFNPSSTFYLSLGINYPNKSDRVLGKKDRLGGDIFVHGNCVTIGCIPLTDPVIKELYVLAVEAKNAGNSIKIHIFPSKDFDELLNQTYSLKEKLFWKNIKEGHDFFEKYRNLFNFFVDQQGAYVISK